VVASMVGKNAALTKTWKGNKMEIPGISYDLSSHITCPDCREKVYLDIARNKLMKIKGCKTCNDTGRIIIKPGEER